MIYDRLGRVQVYEGIYERATMEQQHKLRIQVKRLRYTLEFLRDVLRPSVKAVIDDLKMMQDHLGDLNDAKEACELIDDLLMPGEGENGYPLFQNQTVAEFVEKYFSKKQAEQDRLSSTFLETWQHFSRPEFRVKLAEAISAI